MIGTYKIQNLLHRLRQGDEQAFVIIYNHYWKKLYYVAYKKIENQSAAEEVVQDVFLNLWTKRESLNIESLPAYLAAMVRYGVYRHYAREKSLQERIQSNFKGEVQEDNLSDEVHNKLILDKIFELSNTLPEKCRLVFQYSKLEDQSLIDIAERLNISPKTAEAHLTKALKTVRLNLRGFLMLCLYCCDSIPLLL